MPEKYQRRTPNYDTPLFALRIEARLSRIALARQAFPGTSNPFLTEIRIGELEKGRRQAIPDELLSLSRALGKALNRPPAEVYERLAPHQSDTADSLLGRRNRSKYSYFKGGLEI